MAPLYPPAGSIPAKIGRRGPLVTMSIAILVVLLGLMYLVLIVPRQRDLRRHNRLMASIAEGDEVMTGAGVYGTITAIEGDYALLHVADGVELKVAKKSIASLVTDPGVQTAFTDEHEEAHELEESDEPGDTTGI